MTFNFIQNPDGSVIGDNDLIGSALDQPLSAGSTVMETTAGSLLSTPLLGTSVRELSIPQAAPPTDGGLGDTIGAINRAISPDGIIRNILGTGYAGQEVMTEDAYKVSPAFRKDVPWQQGMTADRANALADMDDRKKVREFYGAKRPVLAFVGNILGQAADPLNYIPIFGELVQAANVARFGRIAGGALTSSLDAAVNTAIGAVATAPVRQRLGDDVSWQATVSQVAMAAAIGGAFGATGGVIGKALDRRQARIDQLSTLKNVQASRVVMNDAIDGMIHDGQVSLSRVSGDELVRLADEDLPQFAQRTAPDALSVERVRVESAYQMDPAAIENPDPYGSFQQTMRDLPEPVNQRFQAHGMMAASDGANAESRLFDLIDNGLSPDRQINSGSPRGGLNGVDSTRTQAPYVLLSDPDRTLAETGIKNVVVQGPAEVNLPTLRQENPTVNFMTPAEARQFMETGIRPARPAARRSTAAADFQGRTQMLTRVPATVEDAAALQAGKRVGRPEASRELAEQFRVDPRTGAFPEEADVRELIASGRVSEEDLAMLDDADMNLKTATAYGEAVQAFAKCSI